MAGFMQSLDDINSLLRNPAVVDHAIKGEHENFGAETQDYDRVLYAMSPMSGENEAKSPSERPDPSKGTGLVSEVWTLYSDSEFSYYHNWTDKSPISKKLLEATEENLQDVNVRKKSFAIVHYRTVVGNERKTMRTHKIEIYSPILLEVFHRVFAEYPNFDVSSIPLILEPPFLAVVHRWQELQRELLENESKANAELRMLLSLLEKEKTKDLSALEGMKRHGNIKFEDLPLCFSPGELVVYRELVDDDDFSAGLLRKTQPVFEEDTNTILLLQLTVDVVNWSGTQFGYEELTRYILPFEGVRKITSLSVSPLSTHVERDRILACLLKRGRMFERLRGQHIRSYSGTAKDGIAQSEKLKVSERIIVDGLGYWQMESDTSPPKLRPLERTNTSQNPEHIHTEGVAESQSLDLLSKESETILTDDQCVLTVPTVRCFSFDRKNWSQYAVERINTFDWNSQAFSNLVLDENTKKLLQALVTRQSSSQQYSFDDFVQGKGQGLIMLLLGPSGVGKTLTAESVSERVKRPLYRLDAADLGSSTYSVELNLKTALKRCAHWNAVLLIDEADVFLECRSRFNSDRNEIVSIFLRLLEYYRGILILTTNRVSSIDPAFESRIDLILKYEPLTVNAQWEIWENFVKRLDPNDVDLSESDLTELSRKGLNGRQIKSAIKTGLVLASYEGKPLDLRHLQVVLDIRAQSQDLLGPQSKDLPTGT